MRLRPLFSGWGGPMDRLDPRKERAGQRRLCHILGFRITYIGPQSQASGRAGLARRVITRTPAGDMARVRSASLAYAPCTIVGFWRPSGPPCTIVSYFLEKKV